MTVALEALFVLSVTLVAGLPWGVALERRVGGGWPVITGGALAVTWALTPAVVLLIKLAGLPGSVKWWYGSCLALAFAGGVGRLWYEWNRARTRKQSAPARH